MRIAIVSLSVLQDIALQLLVLQTQSSAITAFLSTGTTTRSINKKSPVHNYSQCFMEQQKNYDKCSNSAVQAHIPNNTKRRKLILSAGGGFLGGMFSFGDENNNEASAATSTRTKKSNGPTNEVIKVVNGIKHRRLGGSDIVVSELGLGTQRYVYKKAYIPCIATIFRTQTINKY